MNKQIAIRVDASDRIGTGHFMRCISLADALSRLDYDIIFLGRHHNPKLLQILERSGHSFRSIGDNSAQSSGGSDQHDQWLGVTQFEDAQDTVKALEGLSPIGLIVDHYALDVIWEDHITQEIDIPILAIDDLCRQHSAAIIVDATYGRDASAYASSASVALAGSDFALLRPEFVTYRGLAMARRSAAGPVSRLLLAMGGADLLDLSRIFVETTLPYLRQNGWKLDVLTGAAYQHAERLDQFIAPLGDVVVHHHNTTAVAPLIAEADLCIGAAGTSTWERCCLGLPTISIALAENQRDILQQLTSIRATHNGGEFFGKSHAEIALSMSNGQWHQDHLLPLCINTAERQRMSQLVAALVDGKGAMRVAAAFAQHLVADDQLWLRPVSMADATNIYQWRYFGDAAKFYRETAVPDFAAHLAWLETALGQPSRHLLIAQEGGADIAHLRFDVSALGAEISISVNPEFRGKKKGHSILASALEYGRKMKLGTITARVHENNLASVRLFRSVGFSPVSQEGKFFVMEKKNTDEMPLV